MFSDLINREPFFPRGTQNKKSHIENFLQPIRKNYKKMQDLTLWPKALKASKGWALENNKIGQKIKKESAMAMRQRG